MRKKVLLVEDNSELLELLRLCFKAAGFAVATAPNGVAALELTRSQAPDVIVLDLMLPELDGLAVCDILRKDPATAAIPIIMLTGLSGQLSRLAGLESGADDYLVKPVKPNDLVLKATNLLHNRSQPPALAAEANV
jgi:DNA-binding response OmpR family regulator